MVRFISLASVLLFIASTGFAADPPASAKTDAAAKAETPPAPKKVDVGTLAPVFKI